MSSICYCCCWYFAITPSVYTYYFLSHELHSTRGSMIMIYWYHLQNKTKAPFIYSLRLCPQIKDLIYDPLTTLFIIIFAQFVPYIKSNMNHKWDAIHRPTGDTLSATILLVGCRHRSLLASAARPTGESIYCKSNWSWRKEASDIKSPMHCDSAGTLVVPFCFFSNFYNRKNPSLAHPALKTQKFLLNITF